MAKAKEIDKTLYTETSIESLNPRDFTRLKPGVYCGDTTYSTQLLVEMFSNAVDEYTIGHCKNIDVYVTNTRMAVFDDGQGFIPNSFRDDGKTILEAAFSVLNTSGKYREDGSYEGTSLGSFGIGSKLVCFLSKYLDVTTYRNQECEHILFKDGLFEKRDGFKYKDFGSGANELPAHGTHVIWDPDEQFFTHVEVNLEEIRKLFKTISCLCPGLTIRLITPKNPEEIKNNTTVFTNNVEVFKSENGLSDLVDEAVAGKELIKNRFSVSFLNGKNKIDMIMTYTSNYSSTLVPYVNTGLTASGPHITQIKSLITREFNKFFRDKKWLKEKDENLSGDDLQEGLYIVFNITAPNVAYDSQVKTRIVKLDMSPFIGTITDEMREWFTYNEKDLKMIADKAISAKKARVAAQKARDAVREKVPKSSKAKVLNLPTKLVDCWSKKREDCELFICEGDSAAGSLVAGRDAEFTAVFPVRGKVISAYKNSIEKIFANAEIVNIIKAIGLELDKKTNKLVYDSHKLRYGKIFLAADADPDGASIRNLLIEMFWWLCPELIENGHIYTTIPPLFRITTKKNEYIFLKDQKALDEYKAKHQGEKYLISRNKGLGEQDPEEIYDALLNPETRNVEQLQIVDKEETAKLIECLLGPSVPPRREYLLKHSEEANEND